MEVLKVKTPKSTQNLSVEVKRADPAVTAKEYIVIGAILMNSNLGKYGVYAGYYNAVLVSNQLAAAQFPVKALNGVKLKQLKIAGTGAKTLFVNGDLDFMHIDNTAVQNKVSLSTFADEYKYLDTLLTIPVEYQFNQNNGIVIDITSLAKDETIRIDLMLCDFNDIGAE